VTKWQNICIFIADMTTYKDKMTCIVPKYIVKIIDETQAADSMILLLSLNLSTATKS
jgi:hypothetical protein